MSIRTIIVAMLALVFGSSAAFVVMNYLAQQTENAKPETLPVVVATTDIGRAVVITKDLVTIREWPKSHVPLGVATKIEDVVDRATQSSLVKDEPVFMSKVADGHGLQSIIRSGMRAYTIATPSVSSGVGGFIQPDDRVDVLLTITSEERSTGGGISTVLLQNVEVLAAGPSLETGAGRKVEGQGLNSITLLVTTRQAQELTLAQTRGVLHLALRRDGDTIDQDTAPLYLADLQFLRERANTVEVAKPPEPTPEPKPAPPPQKIVRTIPPIYIRTLRGVATGIVIVRPGSTYTEEVETPTEITSGRPDGGGWELLKSLFPRT